MNMINMKFIDKCRALTEIGMKKNMELEYKKAIDQIKLAAKNGRTSSKFDIFLFYENRDEIYVYIMDKLKYKGFKVEVEKYGCNNSYTRLNISWKE